MQLHRMLHLTIPSTMWSVETRSHTWGNDTALWWVWCITILEKLVVFIFRVKWMTGNLAITFKLQDHGAVEDNHWIQKCTEMNGIKSWNMYLLERGMSEWWREMYMKQEPTGLEEEEDSHFPYPGGWGLKTLKTRSLSEPLVWRLKCG